MRMRKSVLLCAIISLALVSLAYAGKDLDTVKKKGFIQAGVNARRLRLRHAG